MKTIDDLRDLLRLSFPNKRIYLFGSRARGNASAYSDIDVAIDSDVALSSRLSQARFVIE